MNIKRFLKMERNAHYAQHQRPEKRPNRRGAVKV
jgi:hypothetical protein